MDNLYQLIYRSRATRPFSEEELSELLRRSRAYNELVDVTGVLFYGDGTFVQILEGDATVIRSIFSDRILKDWRHYMARIIHLGPIQDRKYHDWKMAFKTLAPEKMKKLTGYMDLDAYESQMGTENLQGFLKTLSEFSLQFNRP